MCIRDRFERDGHVAGVGELHGVADEIQKDLPEPNRISDHGGRDVRRHETGEFEVFATGGFCKQIHRIFNRLSQAELDPFQLQFAGLDFREIKDFIDDVQEPGADVYKRQGSDKPPGV